MKTYLLDTSIQVKRLTDRRWKSEKTDYIWEEVAPLVSNYTFMEFKNSLIKAIEYLICLINEIANDPDSCRDVVGIRLRDIVEQLTVTNMRISSRKIRLALAVAIQVLRESKYYPRFQKPDEVIEILRHYAEDLQSFWFYWYPRNGRPERASLIDTVNCRLGKERSPVADGLHNFRCRRGEFKCGLVSFSGHESMNKVCALILDKRAKIESDRLRTGVIRFVDLLTGGRLDDGRSVGQTVCWPIGDAIILAKTLMQGIGIMTADSDMRTIAILLGRDWVYIDKEYSLQRPRDNVKYI